MIAANLGLQCLKNTPDQGSIPPKEIGDKELKVGVDYPYILQVRTNGVYASN